MKEPWLGLYWFSVAMKHLTLAAFLLTPLVALRAADSFLVENGQAHAQIVIASDPPRSTRLAAHDLQTYIEKISGAKLSIVTEVNADVPAKIYVGRSTYTDKLNITADDLKDGAYRIVSGDHWLALIGDDTDFTPIEPWAKNNGDIASGKLQSEWDKITGAPWGVPNATMYKHRISLPGDIGRPTAQGPAGKSEKMLLWGFDERGSFNAVCGFLRSLGVRWYLPGELGEVVPSLKSIPLQKLDETMRPDFPVRRFNIRFGTNGPDTSMWAMHLGMRDPNGLQVAHGMDTMTHRDEIFAAHPEWFALYGGKRQTQPGQRLNQLCYSNEELFQETVRYARAQFDHYNFESVSIMPPDGYTAICQCKLCEGRDSPERDERGHLSDYVWDFVNRVAKEVGRTHPNKKILCCAYGVYTLPPLKIAKLEPNVLVCIVGGRRPTSNKPEQQDDIRKLRESWTAKTSNPILIFENYPFTDRGWYLPSFVPHTLGAGINATKGISQGEDIWLTVRQDFDKVGIGFNHFMVYFTAQMYWGGNNQDVDAMFREYCRLFYGPAENEMRAFFEYCETGWQDMEKDKTKADAALELFSVAQKKVGANSIHGKRIALIDDYLKGLRNKSQQLGQKRGPVPFLRLVGEASGKIVIDGKLDDAAWEKCPAASTGRLYELQTGRQPIFGTTVKTAWTGNDAYFAIHCDEPPGEKLNISTTKKDDSALWYGDAVEILLETESRSYYQIAINPAGAICDLDRSAPRNAWFSWDSQAEVATHIDDNGWTAEVRIPVTQDENDPLHQVIGHKPTPSLPWHLNICRQRIRENGTEASAFSPTGTDNFHHVMKFAHFYDGRSHQFEAAEPDDDYLNAYRTSYDLTWRSKHAEALPAFTAMADGRITDFQKAVALELAAASARALQKHDLANELATRIPIEAVKKTTLMQNLLARQKAPEVIARFGKENISGWPFWKAGDGFFTRGRAYSETGDGAHAEADLLKALDLITDDRIHADLWMALGGNREKNLRNPEQALAAYQQIVAMTKLNGNATYYYGILAATRILRENRKYDEALVTLRKVDFDKLRGTWRGSMLLALGDTLQAADRKDEALTTYKSMLMDKDIEPNQRKTAEKGIENIQSQK